MGLSRQHHGELNRGNVSLGRLQDLRRWYSGDFVAQQQIDVYDGSTEYHIRMRQYIEALKCGDEQRQIALDEWFRVNYPDIH